MKRAPAKRPSRSVPPLTLASATAAALGRRGFLQATWVAASGLLALSACGGEDEPSDEGNSERYFPQSVASGDPRPNSVVLWTRVEDASRPGEDLELTLVIALDASLMQRVQIDGQSALPLRARADFDHCVKVRVVSLDPGRHYYYRFGYRSGGRTMWSRVGRTKTAPAEDADVPIRFAIASCQNYDEKHYYAYRLLHDRELDFVVHLGDYVYESGRERAGGRTVVFRRPEEALDLGGGRLVARSVDNYRDLYRTYRSDPDLQRLHESFPMIAIWDDHEFSNDCHGATATYEEGRRDELDLQRRAAADQAWFEYMPLDDEVGPATPFAAEDAFPENFGIYRSFVFGQHVELVMTDVRRYRPDHVVPEDAFPAAIFATEEEVLQSEGELPVTEPVPCVDITSYEEHAAFLRAHAETLGFRADAVAGLLSVEGVNALIEQAGDPLAPPPLDPGAEGGLRGYAVHQLLKRAGFTNAGARYLVAVEPFGVYSRKRYRETEGASERLFGATQREWFLDTLQRSSRTFKFWGTSLCFMPRHIDMTDAEPLPPELQTRIAISAEDWDGCPNERTALLRELASVRNVIALSGDLHCFFVGVPFDSQEPSNRIVEFVTGAVSSSTWLTEIREIAESDPSIPPAVALAATGVGSLLVDPARKPNPHLAFQELERNGVTVLEVDGQMLRAELLSLPADIVATKPDAVGEAWLLHSRSDRFQVRASTGELERDIQGRVWRWDRAQASWVAL